MNWKLWARKLLVGALVSAGIGLCGYVLMETEKLDPKTLSPFLVMLLPLAKDAIGAAQNWLKHRGDAK